MDRRAFAEVTNKSHERSAAPGPRAASRRTAAGLVFRLVASICLGAPAATGAAASPTEIYTRMAPIEAYLMDTAEEIALARSAAPEAVSRNATILVLTPSGYERAVTGDNGFVCWVGRGFGAPFDWPERLNPKIRAAECLNAPAARSVLPLGLLRTSLFLAGRTTAETVESIRTALSSQEIPPLEPGAMSYMMSPGSYLSDQGDHNLPHVMFFGAVDDTGWGGNLPGLPVLSSNFWFFVESEEAALADLPSLSVIIVGVASWSDGSPAHAHQMR